MITLNNRQLVSLAVLAACGLGNPAWCQGYSLLDYQTNPSAPGAIEKLPTGLLDGAQLGNPTEVYSGIKNFWNEDPVSRVFKEGIDLTVQTGNGLLQQIQQPATKTNVTAPTGDDRYQPSSAVQADALNQQILQLQQPWQQGAPLPRTPNGRFDYYRPIFEQQARRLNEEQRQQQEQYRDYLRSKYLLENRQ